MDWNNLQPVKGHTHLFRDKRNGAIVNTNFSEMEQSKQRILMAREKRAEDEKLQSKVLKLETDILVIKNMLKIITENVNGL